MPNCVIILLDLFWLYSREQRVTGFCIHLLVGFSVLLTSVLRVGRGQSTVIPSMYRPGRPLSVLSYYHAIKKFSYNGCDTGDASVGVIRAKNER